MASRSKSLSTAEMSLQIRDQLENVNDMVSEIEVTSQAQANEEVLSLVETISEDKDWDVQIGGMNKAMQLIKGGLLQYRSVIKDLSRISTTLVAGSRNLRSALVKTSTMLLSQLAKELREEFDVMGEVIQPLSTQTSHGTQIIADSCRYTILVVITNVPTMRTLRAVFDLAGSRAGPNRQTAAEGLGIMLKDWKGSVVDKNVTDIAANIVKLVTDAQAETRQLARVAAAAFIAKYPAKKGEILDRVDERTRSQIASTNPGEMTSEIAKPEGEAPKKRKSLLPTSQRMAKTAVPKKRENEVVKSEMPPPRMPRNPSPPQAAAPPRQPATASYQRKPKSPEFKKPQKTAQEKVVLDEETEELLAEVEECVNTNREFVLESEMDHVVEKLVECAQGNAQLQKRVEPFIEQLITAYPDEFEASMPILFNCYFETNESIVNSIEALYDANKVLAVAVDRAASPGLVDLLGNLCSQDNIDLRNEGLCARLMDIAVSNKSAAAEKIILAVKRQHPEMVMGSSNEYVQSVIKSVGPPGFPPFDPHDVNFWCTTIKEYVSGLSRNKWLDEADSLYREIATAIDLTNEKTALFALTLAVMKAQGPDCFSVLVTSLISYWKSKYAPNIPRILKCIVKNGDNVVLINSILGHLDDPELVRPALDVLAEVMTLCKDKEKVRPIVPTILEELEPLIFNEATDIRKSTVFCYVAVSGLFKQDVDKAIQKLTLPQQKLIALYRQTKR